MTIKAIPPALGALSTISRVDSAKSERLCACKSEYESERPDVGEYDGPFGTAVVNPMIARMKRCIRMVIFIVVLNFFFSLV
jgi:hypothetical protein